MDRILFLCLCGVFLLLPFIHSYTLSNDEEDLNDVDSEIEALLDKRQTDDDDGWNCLTLCEDESEEFDACVNQCLGEDGAAPDKRLFGRFFRKAKEAIRRVRVSERVRRFIRRIRSRLPFKK